MPNMLSTSPIPGKGLDPTGRLPQAVSAPTADHLSALPADLDSVVSGTRQPVEEERIALRSLPQNALSLNDLPVEIMREIGAYLPYRDYSTLRLTCKDLRNSLLPTRDLMKTALKGRGESAKQALSWLNSLGTSNYKEIPFQVQSKGMFDTLNTVGLSHSVNRLSLSYTSYAPKPTPHKKMSYLAEKFRDALCAAGHKRSDLKLHIPGPQPDSDRWTYWIEVPTSTGEADTKKCLEMFFQAAHEVCCAPGAGCDELIIASALGGLPSYYLDWKVVSLDTWNTIVKPYRFLLEVGDIIPAHFNGDEFAAWRSGEWGRAA